MTTCDVETVVRVLLSTEDTEPGEEFEIPPTCEEDGIWWTALDFPAFGMRYTTAPPSAWVPGEVRLGAVLDASTVPLAVVLRYGDLTDLITARDDLETLLATWSLHVEVTAQIGADPAVSLGSWDAGPTAISWGSIRPQRLDLFVLEGTCSIPVNPTGAP